jgi:sugar/nucleoside kinase (ribokinase family)
MSHCYIKPLEDGDEASRIDMGNFNRLSDEVAGRLVEQLSQDLPGLDIVIVNQQVVSGIHGSGLFQDGLQSLISAHPDTMVLLDSRDMSGRYAGTIRKINAYEAVTMVGGTADPMHTVSLDDAEAAAAKLAVEWGRPIFVTLGGRGCLVADGERIETVACPPTTGPTDPVGAGDSMISGVAAALATGLAPAEAAAFGNLVATVTVQKLHQTGTASPDEIRAVGGLVRDEG